MSVLHEMALEVAARLDSKADFLLIMKPKGVVPEKAIIATNVGRPALNDMLLEGTSTYVMDQVFKQRYEKGA